MTIPLPPLDRNARKDTTNHHHNSAPTELGQNCRRLAGAAVTHTSTAAELVLVTICDQVVAVIPPFSAQNMLWWRWSSPAGSNHNHKGTNNRGTYTTYRRHNSVRIVIRWGWWSPCLSGNYRAALTVVPRSTSTIGSITTSTTTTTTARGNGCSSISSTDSSNTSLGPLCL